MDIEKDVGNKMERYSYSRLEAYDKCAKQYKLNYIDKIKPPRVNVEGFMGNRVHESLEFLYKEANYLKIPTIEDVIACYVNKWNEFYDNKVTINNPKYDLNYYHELGKKLLTSFYASHKDSFGKGMVIDIEKKVEFFLDEDQHRYLFVGKIDRVHQSPDGIYELHDYKTGKNVYTQSMADHDKQLSFYQFGIDKDFKLVDEEVRLYWHFLVPDKVLESRRDRSELNRLITDTIEKIKMIESSTSFPATCAFLCKWCAYKDTCVEFLTSSFADKGNKGKVYSIRKSKGEIMTEENNRLVADYTNAVEDYKRIKDTGLMIRQDIIKQVEKTNKRVIKGEDYKLEVNEIETTEIVDEPKLIEWLKQHNILDQVISISVDKLNKELDKMDIFTADEATQYLNFKKDYKINIEKLDKSREL